MIRRLRRMSLRTRLVTGIVVLMAAGLTISNVAGLVLIRSYQLQRVDQQLTIGPLGVNQAAPKIDTEELCSIVTRTRGASPQLPTRYSLAVLSEDGSVLCRLPSQPTNLGAPDLAALQAQLPAATDQPVTVPSTGAAPPWRVRTIPVSGGYAVIGISLADEIDTAARLQLITTIVAAVILLLAGFSGWFIVRLGLKPLTTIEQTADAIAQGDLSRRIDAPPVSTEVGRLAASLNAMLTQVEEGFDERLRTEDRLRQFLADASHELRTPLASIRGHAEMYRQGIVTDSGDVAITMSRIESEAIRMGNLVDDLLLLARLDTRPGLASEPVDLLAVAADVVVDARARDPQRRVSLTRLEGDDWQDEPSVVTGDEARIRQILTNLISNVLRYTPSRSPYEVTVGTRTDGVRMSVIDHGPGIDAAAAPMVFERFYRDDYGRARSAGGAGLGLSIVTSLMTAHGGTAAYEPTPGGGCTFALTFPIAADRRAVARSLPERSDFSAHAAAADRSPD